MATVFAVRNKNNKIESFIYGACFICVATAGELLIPMRGLLPMLIPLLGHCFYSFL